MSQNKDKIYVVIPDENERSVIVDAALEPSGYEVKATDNGNEALSLIMRDQPDVLVMDLHPKGLSGQDVLVALQSQAYDFPVIVIGDQGGEREALNAFRLGAKDYMLRPIREAELIQVVERALRDLRMQRERETLIREIRSADEQVGRRLRELKTLMGIGKSVAALNDVDEIFERVIRAAIQLTKADAVGFYIRSDEGDLILRAGKNLSRNLVETMNKPVQDALATLVMNSQETYRGDGEGLKRMSPAQEDANAVIYAPMVINEQSLGVLWVANARRAFEPHMNDIMSALADYTAIAMFNAHLFRSIDAQPDNAAEAVAETVQEAVTSTDDEPAKAEEEPPEPPEEKKEEPAAVTQAPPNMLDVSTGERISAQQVVNEVRAPLTQILANVSMFKNGEMGVIPQGNRAAVDVIHRQVEELIAKIDDIVPPDTAGL